MPRTDSRRDRPHVRLSGRSYHVVLRPALSLSGQTPPHTDPPRAGSHPCRTGLCPRVGQGRRGLRHLRAGGHQRHHRPERRHRRLDATRGHHGSGGRGLAGHRRLSGDRRGGHHPAHHQVGLSDTLGRGDSLGRGKGLLHRLDGTSRPRGARLHQRRPAGHGRVELQAHQLHTLVQPRSRPESRVDSRGRLAAQPRQAPPHHSRTRRDHIGRRGRAGRTGREGRHPRGHDPAGPVGHPHGPSPQQGHGGNARQHRAQHAHQQRRRHHGHRHAL